MELFSTRLLFDSYFICTTNQAETSLESPPAPVDVVKIIIHNTLIYHRKNFFQVPETKIFSSPFFQRQTNVRLFTALLISWGEISFPKA